MTPRRPRPRIVCHMTMSVDGRQLPERWSDPAEGVDGDRLDSYYDEVAARFDAEGWIVGRVTMEEFTQRRASLSPLADAPVGRSTHVGARNGRNVAVAIDPHGKLHYGQDHAAGDHIIAVLSDRVADAYLEELRRDGVSYLFAGPDGRDLATALETLGTEFGLRALLEGGGRINGAFLKAGLIDEISILVYPGIDGLAGVSSIFEHVGAPDQRVACNLSLRHSGTDTLEGGMVWLRYRVEPAASTNGAAAPLSVPRHHG